MTEQDVQQEVMEVEEVGEALVDGSAGETIEPAQFNQLTKRNQQFLMAVDKNLVAANLTHEVRTAIYNEMMETLVQGQQTGQTARQLYGTPTECVETIMKQQFPTAGEATVSPDWQIALDGGLILGSIFTLITGVSLMNAKGETSGLVLGLITLILNYIIAGGAMLATAKVLPKMDAPKGERGYFKYFAVSTLSMIVWVTVITLASVFLPSSINPMLPYEAYLLIGGVGLALRFYLKKKWCIKGGLF
ncbi:DUF1129 domain-containing protein [Aerococcaceae bacterium NML180378]|nr:DUF1129 domain-containing protein [Aerococcaceae bacterium NML180378]